MCISQEVIWELRRECVQERFYREREMEYFNKYCDLYQNYFEEVLKELMAESPEEAMPYLTYVAESRGIKYAH